MVDPLLEKKARPSTLDILGLSESDYQKIKKQLRSEIPALVNTGFCYELDRNLTLTGVRISVFVSNEKDNETEARVKGILRGIPCEVIGNSTPHGPKPDVEFAALEQMAGNISN